MNSVFTPTLSSQCRTALAANSGPLRSDVLRWPMLDEQVGQALQHIVRPQPSRHHDGQAATGKLVDHAQHAERPAILGPILHEVVRPDVVGPLGPQPYTRPVVEPQTASFGLLLRHFKPFPAPDPPHALDVHPPALVDQQPSNPSIAVASVLRRQTLDRRRQRGFIIANLRTTTLRRPRLADNRTGTAFRDGNPGAHVLHARALAGRAQYFPSSASFRISLSNVSSETAFFSLWFSRSRSFKRRA